MKMRTNDKRFARVNSSAAVLAAVAGAAMGIAAPSAHADPQGADVVRGNVQFERNGATTVIRASNKSIINYESFNIDSGETVRFIQPGARSRVLNRVSGAAPSHIDGALLANGRVYIVNPAGVIFGQGATVDVGRLFAAGADLSNADFIRGVNRFTNVTGEVVSRGRITADQVHLIGAAVRNHGTIVADRGIVTMTVGEEVLIGDRGGNVYVRLPSDAAAAQSATLASDSASVENTGEINAPQGRISLGAGDTLSLAVRNSGSLRASGGDVEIDAGPGRAHNSGDIDVGVDRGQAGDISIRGDRVVHDGAARAVSHEGRSGHISITSTQSTTLGDGSLITVAGGDGVADAGEILVHAFEGDTLVRPGAQVDLSGGARGGDAGFAEISAADSLGVHGEIVGAAALGYAPATVLFDPLDIIIGFPGADNGEIAGDGEVGAGESPGDTFSISPLAIENFAGNVLLEAVQDIFINASINKTNGGLTLDAGRDLVFELAVPSRGGAPTDLNITADFIDFSAGRNIADRTLFGADVTAASGDLTFLAGNAITKIAGGARVRSIGGDIDLTAQDGSITIGRAGVDSGRAIAWTQSDDLLFGAGPFGLIEGPEATNIDLNITGGDLTFGGEFGGVSGAQEIGGLNARSTGTLLVEDDLTINGPASLQSIGADVDLQGFIHAAGDLSITALGDITTDPLATGGLRSGAGDIDLTAQTGAVDINLATLETNNRFVRWTQADDLLLGAGPFGVIGNPENTNLVVRVTDGFFILGGEFGGVSGAQSIRSVDARSTGFLRVDDNLTIGTFADLRSDDAVQIDGFIHADESINLHSGLDGSGDLSFLSGGLDLHADEIALRAGSGDGLGLARVDARTNSPIFRGAAGGDTRPTSFIHQQDASIPDGEIALASQFGDALGGDSPMTYLLESRDGFITIDDGAHFTGADLTIDSATGTTVNAPVAVSRLLVRGPAMLAADIDADTTQTYQGATRIDGDVSLSAEQTTFDDIIDAIASGEATLTIDSDATFGGSVGSNAPLGALTVNGRTLVLMTAIITVGDQQYNGAFVIEDDTEITSAGGEIRFGGTVDGGHDLFVTTSEDGLIVFADDVGLIEALRDLRLSTAGDDGVRAIAKRATIVGENSLTFNVRDFVMGTGEKFTTLGDLQINAARDVELSDLVTIGDMAVAANRITLLRRQPGQLQNSDGDLVDDRGLDFVAGGLFDFSGVILLGGDPTAPDPVFANISAIGGPALGRFDLVAIDQSEVTAQALTFMDQTLDQRAPEMDDPGPEPGPPGPDDPSDELAGARVRDPLFEDSVTPGLVDLLLMQQIAIDARLPGAEEARSAFAGRALYNNLPAAAGQFDDPYPVIATRLDRDAVADAVEVYNELFSPDEENRTAEVARTIAASMTRYFALSEAGDFDPAAARNYLEASPEESAALAYVNRLRDLLTEVRQTGLTLAEYRRVRDRLLAAVAPEGEVSVEEFAAMVERRSAVSAEL